MSKIDPNAFPEHGDEDNTDEVVDRGDEFEEENDEAPEPEKAKSEAKEDEEGTEEGDEEEIEGDDEPKKTDGQKIPYKRFQQVVDARRKAEERVAQLEAEIKKRDENSGGKLEEVYNKLDQLYEDVEDARAKGDTKTAASIQREIDKINRTLGRAESTYLARKEAMQAQQNILYNATVDQLEMLEPRLSPDSDAFDEGLANEIRETTEAFEAKGYAPADALKKAARLVLGEDVFGKRRPVPKKEEPPKPQKKTTDVKKNVDAYRKQPPKPGIDREERAGEINPSLMTEEEFDALPKSVKAKYRGDFL